MIKNLVLPAAFAAGLLSFSALAVTIVLPGLGEIKIGNSGQSDAANTNPPAPSKSPAARRSNEPASGPRSGQRRPSDQEGDDDISSSARRPVEIQNDISAGFAPTPERRRLVPGLDPVKTAGATYGDALRCAALLDLANIIDKRIEGFNEPNHRVGHPVWDKMIDLHPKMKNMPFSEADNMRNGLLRQYISDNFDRYSNDHDLLRRDYKQCRAMGLLR